MHYFCIKFTALYPFAPYSKILDPPRILLVRTVEDDDDFRSQLTSAEVFSRASIQAFPTHLTWPVF